MTLPASVVKKMSEYPAFYQKVWLACSQIPAGQTRTYGEVARMVGRPAAARAVGQALARNPFAPTVPCHRVVGANGALTGYSGPGGLATKQRMLLREKRLTTK